MVQPKSLNPTISRKSNSVDAHVGARARFRRILLGLSQETVGESLGLTFQQVQKYENGRNRISAGRLFELAHILGVNVQYFYEELPGSTIVTPGSFRKTNDDQLIDFMNSREGIALNRALLEITDSKVRLIILELARSLSDAQK